MSKDTATFTLNNEVLIVCVWCPLCRRSDRPSVHYKLMHLSICNLNNPPGIWIFRSLAVKFPYPSSKKLFKCPTCKTRWMGKQPTKASLTFYGCFLVSHSVTNAISCLLNRLTVFPRSCLALMVRTVKLPTFSGLVSDCPPSAASLAWCQIAHPRSGSKVKFPAPGENEGVKCPWYARRGGCWDYIPLP